MDKKSIEEISLIVEKLANRYPHIKLYLIMAEPCAEHYGAHLDLASCGDADLCALVDAALTHQDNTIEPSATVN